MILTKDSYFKFSGGEVHCKYEKTDTYYDTEITCLDYSSDGFMALCQYSQILREKTGKRIKLTYPYLPYARQDRWIAQHEPFSLKLFCAILNAQEFESVTILDPHSDVTPALINNCMVWEQHLLAKRILPKSLFANPDTVWVSPDAGAYKKLSKLIHDDLRIAIGTKMRGPGGVILRSRVHSPVDLTGKECIIIDDICDGGRTFIELAKELRNMGAAKIVLYVTHGIFSKGLEVLKEVIDHVYTTNSFPQPQDEFLTVGEII